MQPFACYLYDVIFLSRLVRSQITSIMNWMVRTASEVETNIVSVERVEEYAAVKQEVRALTVESSRFQNLFVT